MTRSLVSLAFCLIISHTALAADTPPLEETGLSLGRVALSDVPASFHISFPLGEDKPLATHVMARFQNNRPLQWLPAGDWVSWNERTDSLVDLGLAPADDGSLTFQFEKDSLPTTFLPVTITLAYRTETGMKSGYLVIDR